MSITTLLIDYPKAVEMGIEDEVEKIFMETVPLPKIEKVEVISEWKAKGTSKVVLMSKISGKYKERVLFFIEEMYK